MKIWEKIFISSLTIFLTAFGFGAFILIDNSTTLALEREIQSSISQHKMLAAEAVFYEISNQRYGQNDTKTALKDYFDNLGLPDAFIEIFNEENELIYSKSAPVISAERTELLNASYYTRNYIAREIEDSVYLYVVSLVNIGNNVYKLSYVHDITYIFQDRDAQAAFFVKLFLLVFVILAGCMFVLSRYLTKPIYTLTETTKTIAEGDYSKRAALNSKDELGLLVENFNKMASAIESKIQQLENTAEEKQRFINNLTHELKTPLTSIIGYADLLRSVPYDEQLYIDGLSHIFNEARRLEELSKKMMNLVSLGRQDFNMEKEKLQCILQDVKQQFIPQLQSKELEFVISCGNLEIAAENDLIRNMLSNIVDNSIKASRNTGRIFATAYHNPRGEITLEIRDEGEGIPAEDLPKVFEAFYMADKARSRKNNSAGLGLALCAEIASIHGADLSIESTVGKGTAVFITFH